MLLVSIGNAAAAGIVRTDLYGDSVAWKDSDVELPHPSADGRENAQTVVAFDLEHRVGQSLLDDAIELELVAFWFFSLPTLTHSQNPSSHTQRGENPFGYFTDVANTVDPLEHSLFFIEGNDCRSVPRISV